MDIQGGSLEMWSVTLRPTTKSYTNTLKNSTDNKKWNYKQYSSNPQEGRENKTVKCKQRDKIENKTWSGRLML